MKNATLAPETPLPEAVRSRDANQVPYIGALTRAPGDASSRSGRFFRELAGDGVEPLVYVADDGARALASHGVTARERPWPRPARDELQLTTEPDRDGLYSPPATRALR